MSKAAILAIRIIADAAGAKKGFAETETSAQRMERKLGSASKVAAAGLAALGGGALMAAKAAEEAESANAALSQVFESMGYPEMAAGALAYADSLEQQIGVDENIIKSAQTKLATFSEVASSADLMNRATMLAADMAAAGFGDMAGNANGLGKALQDPITGMSLLTENGSLTRDEQKAIAEQFEKTGDKAEAQASILEALEKQVGGVAVSTADTTEKMRLGWGEVTEEIGKGLLPIMEKALPVVQRMAEWAAKNADKALVAAGALAGLAAAVVTANAAFKAYNAVVKLGHNISKLFTAAQKLATVATKAWSVAVKAAAIAQKALNMALRMNPIGLVVTAIALLVAGFILAYKKSETFRNIVDKLWSVLKKLLSIALKPVILQFKIMSTVLRTVWGWISKLIAKAGELWDKLNPFKSVGNLFGGLFGGRSVSAAPSTAGITGRSGVRSTRATSSGSSVTINVESLDPYSTARAIKLALAGYDISQGRAQGSPLATAW